ncbi:MAG: hypothetical protein B6244_07690 [Candidatus Cloacimonetes bacterium 4572_55]|nr:MAG: hypothetical protein B6244_07690 [Candidatus Cloacimonetes bacterium 4572_55]
MNSYAILTDLTKCIGCEACVYACKEINNLPRNDNGNKQLSAYTWTTIERRNGVNIRHQCMHCDDPACVSVCPVGALTKTASGAVTYAPDICFGCRYCLMACPFEIPKYQWDKTLPYMQKCILCYEKRLEDGKEPACTSVCPTGATIFGGKEELIEVARERIKEFPDRYVDHIYGEREAGGASVLYLTDVPFEKLGFKDLMKDQTYPKLTWRILTHIPNVVTTGAVTLFGIWWIINRRIQVEQESLHQDGGKSNHEK